MDIQTSPFVFDGPVSSDDLVGRDEEIAALTDRATHGRFVLLYGPRRFGKTSIIRRLRTDAETRRNMAVVVADLEGVLTLDDISRRLEDAYHQLPESRVRKTLVRAAAGLADVGVQLGAGPVAVKVRRRGRDPEAAGVVLEALLDLPYRVGELLDTRVLVVLDEFQAIASVANADAVLRSKIQHQRDHVSYLFSGSEQGMLRTIFSDRARPLYGQAEQLVLGPLPSDALAQLITRKFDETGRDPGTALGPLLAFVEGHPQRAALLAHHLWHRVAEGDTGDAAHWIEARDRAVHAARPEFVAVWSALTDPQRRVVRLLAYSEPLHGAAAQRLRLAKSSATSATATLVGRSIVAGEPFRLIDPLFAEWTRTTQTAP